MGILFLMFSGFLLNEDSIPAVFAPLKHISFIRYSFQALAVNELKDNQGFTCKNKVFGPRCLQGNDDRWSTEVPVVAKSQTWSCNSSGTLVTTDEMFLEFWFPFTPEVVEFLNDSFDLLVNTCLVFGLQNFVFSVDSKGTSVESVVLELVLVGHTFQSVLELKFLGSDLGFKV